MAYVMEVNNSGKVFRVSAEDEARFVARWGPDVGVIKLEHPVRPAECMIVWKVTRSEARRYPTLDDMSVEQLSTYVPWVVNVSDSPPQVADPEKKAEMEAGGYLFCRTCGDWFDDTDCYAGYKVERVTETSYSLSFSPTPVGDAPFTVDHSRHCGHVFTPPGFRFDDASTMIVTCGMSAAARSLNGA